MEILSLYTHYSALVDFAESGNHAPRMCSKRELLSVVTREKRIDVVFLELAFLISLQMTLRRVRQLGDAIIATTAKHNDYVLKGVFLCRQRLEGKPRRHIYYGHMELFLRFPLIFSRTAWSHISGVPGGTVIAAMVKDRAAAEHRMSIGEALAREARITERRTKSTRSSRRRPKPKVVDAEDEELDAVRKRIDSISDLGFFKGIFCMFYF